MPPSPSKEEANWPREGETKHMQGRPRHRYSRSLNGSDQPTPIPLPVDEHGGILFPSSTSPVKEIGRSYTGEPYPSSPTKEQPVPRAYTGGSFPVSGATPWSQGTADPPATGRPLPLPPQAPDLPANPKEWLPSHVATYLAGVLRARRMDGQETEDGYPLPIAVVQDIAEFIRRAKVTGRMFLRLTDTSLEEMHVNPLWRSTLLSASRALRQNVLQGRIWGYGSTPASPTKSHYYSSTDEEESVAPQQRPLPSRPSLTGDGYLSSSSASSFEQRGRTSEGRYRNGKVKGMVETFERERSRSESEGSDAHYSPRKPDHRPLPVPPRPAEEEFDEYFDFGGTAKANKGSIRGENKFSSIRGSKGTGSRRKPVGADMFAPPSASSIFASYTVEEPPSLPKKAYHATMMGAGEDEPTIEELLQAEEMSGATAWELTEDYGETAKRISRDMKLLGSARVSGALAWEEEEGKVTIKPAAPTANPIPDFGQKTRVDDDHPSRRRLSDEGVAMDSEPEFISAREEEEERKKKAKEEEEKNAKEEEEACIKLEKAMAQTRAMVAALAKRVGDVEGEIKVMEERAQARELAAATAPKSVWETLSKVFSDPRRAVADLSKLVKQPRLRTTLVFMSLGVCAVALKVAMKRNAAIKH